MGKVFKPTLRLDVAGRMFTALVASLLEGVDHSVDVVEHSNAGAVVHVTVTGKPDADLTAVLSQELNNFAFRHEIEWRDSAAPVGAAQNRGEINKC